MGPSIRGQSGQTLFRFWLPQTYSNRDADRMTWRYLIEGPWIVFIACWALGALNTRRTVKRESFASRYGILFLEILGFVLVFSDAAGIGVLGHRVVNWTYALGVVGVALTWIGIALALWSRWHLGQYWSGTVTLKEDHKAHPHRTLRSPPASHLFRTRSGSNRRSFGH